MHITRIALLSVLLTMLPAMSHAQERPAHKDAYLYFVWPQDGTVIKGAFWARFGLRNMGVTHAGDEFENAGHHHLLIDVNSPLEPNEPIPQDKNHLHFGAGQTETRIELSSVMPSTTRRARRQQKASGQCPLWVRSGHCSATADVRFTLNSDRESGFSQKAMSALPPKADMCGARACPLCAR